MGISYDGIVFQNCMEISSKLNRFYGGRICANFKRFNVLHTR